jgi:hypothetical protein
MKQSVLVAVCSILLVSPAFAQTAGPCSGGDLNPLFSVTLGSDVTIHFEHFKPMTTTVPSVDFDGYAITVNQIVPAVPPPVALCNARTVSLGSLAPGAYHVTWNYRAQLTSANLQTFAFDFTVPETITPISAPVAVVTPAFDPRVLGLLLIVIATAGVWALRR